MDTQPSSPPIRFAEFPGTMISSAQFTAAMRAIVLARDTRPLLGPPHLQVGDAMRARNAAATLLRTLPTLFPLEDLGSADAIFTWEQVAGCIRTFHGQHEGLALFALLYQHILEFQELTGRRIHKGMPLVWISDCYKELRHPALAKRFLMLTLVEDAIRDKGTIHPDHGVYFRAVWEQGMSDMQVRDYGRLAWEVAEQHFTESLFPEWVLQELDEAWMVLPSADECSLYVANRRYISSLLSELGDGTGSCLERLARYVLAVMPGCRARHERSHSTDYDIMCCMEGPLSDFRSELGRYFVCECKDWDRPADFTVMAKFCRVLDSAKCRFGVLFSKHGITGTAQTNDAAREQVKVFQDRGMVIVVVDRADLAALAGGENFIAMLRAKYEMVRMDLRRLKDAL